VGIGDIETLDEGDILRLGNDPVADRLRYMTRVDIEPLVEQYSRMIRENPGKAGFMGYYILYDVIVAATVLIRELKGDPRAVLNAPIQQDRIAEIASSPERFDREVRRIITAVVDCREAAGQGRHGDMIIRSKKYIAEHFADPDISLHTVASQVNVSPNHFSAVFSQEAGMSFIEYLTEIRISRAKELLLMSGMKSGDICYEAGFSDPHYFSFIFKKHTGLSPREYRSKKNEPYSEENQPFPSTV
jgi:two-component system response regulator YesN